MVWPKKASEHKDHISIVRANKSEVNDFFNRDNHYTLCERKYNSKRLEHNRSAAYTCLGISGGGFISAPAGLASVITQSYLKFPPRRFAWQGTAFPPQV